MSYKLPLFAAAAFLGGYMLISNRQLRVNKYELKVSKLPENFVGKKILLLADLHKKRYGDNFNNLVNSCIAAEPDFILFAGDLYSRDETDMIPKLALMKRLKHIAPTYYIFGNHETDNMDNAEALALKLTECGVHILRNNMEQIKIGEDHINIYGTQLPQRFYRNEDFSHHDLPQITKDELTKLLGEPDRSECFAFAHAIGVPCLCGLGSRCDVFGSLSRGSYKIAFYWRNTFSRTEILPTIHKGDLRT